MTGAILLFSYCRPEPGQVKSIRPTLILWAWDRAEDLRFLKSGQAEVAALMATFQLHDGRVDVRRRKLPLFVAPEVPLKAVFRLESDGSELPPPESVSEQIENATRAAFDSVQIDFDARESQLDWYRSLLRGLHTASPSLQLHGRGARNVSITALASWCVDRPWFAAQRPELQDVVPMLFRMGPDRVALLNKIAREKNFAPECRGALGISTDEPLPWYPPATRIYIFNSERWTQDSFDQACARWR